MQNQVRNITIVGAGPAGVIAGNYLLKAGFEVKILERNPRVISTPCGEGISHRALSKLREDIGFDSAPYLSSSIKGLKNFFPGGYFNYVYENGYVLEREAWIDAIRKRFEKKGGEVVFNSNVPSASKIDGDVVVGADGPASVVRRETGCKVDVCPAMQYKMEFEWENHDFLEFYWDLDISDFYSWNFPKNGYFNVGVIGNINQLDRFCSKYGFKGKILKKEGYSIPFNGRGIQRGRYFLIGDAAGMANAFSKGGLAPIIYASDILAHCLKNGDEAYYEKKIMSHPAFSAEFSHTMDVIQALGQDNLRLLGAISNGQDLLHLPVKSKIKFLPHLHLYPKIRVMLRSFKEGMKYAW